MELENGTKIKIICDEVEGTAGPAGGDFSHPVPEEKSVFAYVIESEGLFGPIVMDTDEELRTAFAEYREGNFIS